MRIVRSIVLVRLGERVISACAMRTRPILAALLAVIMTLSLPWAAMLSPAMAGPAGMLDAAVVPLPAPDCSGCMDEAPNATPCAAVFCAGPVAALAELASDTLPLQHEFITQPQVGQGSFVPDLEPPPPRLLLHS